MTRQRHTLCGSSDGNRCDGDWTGYWVLRADGSEAALQREKLPDANQLCWQGFSGSVRFLPNGTSPLSNGRFALCRSGETVWELVINRQGRVRQASASEYGDCCATSHTGQ
jgi:type IV fimbrial biogenesis protein FimT